MQVVGQPAGLAAEHQHDVVGAQLDTGERLARLITLMRPGRRDGVEVAESRFRALLRLLGARAELASALSAHLNAVLAARMHRTLYAESGVLANQGFFSGLSSRLLGRMLPPAVDADFLRDLFSEVFDDAVKNGTLVAGAHLQFPGMGHIVAQGKGYRWIPVNYTQMR